MPPKKTSSSRDAPCDDEPSAKKKRPESSSSTTAEATARAPESPAPKPSALTAFTPDATASRTSAPLASSTTLVRSPGPPSPATVHDASPTALGNPSGAPLIVRVALTGGPCGGKSSLLSLLQTQLVDREQLRVYTVPEAATLLRGCGHTWTNLNRERVTEFQLALLRVQIGLEDQIFAVARATGENCLIVSDRGTMDGRAFCDEDQFADVVGRAGKTLEELRDRYDGVIHLVSAADGAESHYNWDNFARSESVEEAKASDMRLRQMYLGHPHLKIVHNKGTFQEKMNVAMDIIYGWLQRRPPPHRTRRFLLRSPPDWSRVPGAKVTVHITITILAATQPQEVAMLLRRRPVEDSSNETFLYHRADSSNGLTAQHRISEREYEIYSQQRDPSRDVIEKRNTCFSYGGGFFDVAVVMTPARLNHMTVMYTDGEDEMTLPPFLDVIKETTGDQLYSNHGLSDRDRPLEPTPAA